MVCRNGHSAPVDATIDFDVIRESVFIPEPPCRRHFRHGLFFHKRLTAESRHDGHDEEQIDLIEKGNHGIKRRRRIEAKPASKPCRPNPLERLTDIVFRLNMNRDAVRTGIYEAIQVFIRPGHHEMHIERQCRVRADRRDKLGAKGDIFHKMAVHDIEMKPVRARQFGLCGLLTDPRPIGGKKGRGDDSGVAVAHAGGIISTVSVIRKPLSLETFTMVSHSPEENDDPVIDLSSDTFMMSQALRQAQKAYLAEEVPIGAIIVKEGRIIARAHNQVETLRDATAHAEMLALTQAQEAQGDWRLTDCDLYVTKEPCPMCAGAIVHCRIRRVIFGCGDPKGGAAGGLLNLLQQPTLNHSSEITPGVLEEESIQLLKAFFHEARLKKKGGFGE